MGSDYDENLNLNIKKDDPLPRPIELKHKDQVFTSYFEQNGNAIFERFKMTYDLKSNFNESQFIHDALKPAMRKHHQIQYEN